MSENPPFQNGVRIIRSTLGIGMGAQVGGGAQLVADVILIGRQGVTVIGTGSDGAVFIIGITHRLCVAVGNTLGQRGEGIILGGLQGVPGALFSIKICTPKSNFWGAYH